MGAIKEPALSLYETDFYGWTTETARALRERNYRSLDMHNLIEEIESMGRSEARELTSRLAQLLMHLLKWEYQWLMRSKSWTGTIKVQRQLAARVLNRNPSLRPRLAELVEDAYDHALIAAEKETGLPIRTFPESCPYPIDSILADDWLPPARE